MPKKKLGPVAPTRTYFNPKEKKLVSQKAKKEGESALEKAEKAYKKKMKKKWKIKY